MLVQPDVTIEQRCRSVNPLAGRLVFNGYNVPVADKFVTQIQTQAADETGWNAIRDKFVLPLLINGTIWAIKLVLAKSTTQTDTQ